MSGFVVLVIILGSVLGLLTVFIIKSFITPQRISSLENLIKKGRYTQAIRLAKQLIAKDPHNMDAHYYLGLAYLRDGKEELALMEWKKVNEIGDFSGAIREIPFRKQIAELYARFNQLDEALKEYLLLIKAQPSEAVYYYKAGELFEMKGKAPKAVSFYMKAVELDKRFAKAHYKLGVLFYRHKKPLEAKRELELAVKLEPENYKAYYYLGKLLKDEKNYPEALKMFERAQRDPELKVKVLIERGTCYMSMNNFDRAIPELERAINNLSTESSNEALYARYFLAYCYEKKRDIDKAIAQWEKIYSKKPTFRDVAEKLSQYQELRADDRMKDYLTSPKDHFFELCRKIVEGMKLKIQDMKEIPNGCEIVAVEQETKWRNARKMPRIIQFYRTPDILDEITVRNLHEKMKKSNITRGVIITSSTFSRSAYSYAETRPIDLYNKGKLQELLRMVDI